MDWETQTVLVSSEEVRVVSQSMRRFGGSFIEQLGILLQFADQNNVQKIGNAFSQEWKEYLKLSKLASKCEELDDGIH